MQTLHKAPAPLSSIAMQTSTLQRFPCPSLYSEKGNSNPPTYLSASSSCNLTMIVNKELLSSLLNSAHGMEAKTHASLLSHRTYAFMQPHCIGIYGFRQKMTLFQTTFITQLFWRTRLPPQLPHSFDG